MMDSEGSAADRSARSARSATPSPPSPPSLAQTVELHRDLSGQTLGDFEVLRLLGRGGMGEVYLAEQKSLKRPVALKVLRPELVADEKYLRRFEAEAMAVAPISHPHIVSVISIGEHQGVRYIAMEYVQGKNLREYLAKKGPLDLPIFLTILRKVASALQRAAEEGIIHRDIKPENILLTRKGDVKVADFGLSRQVTDVHLTQSGVTMGTPLYMSPEQVEGKDLDPRSDLYSLGVTCYHMLAGEPPYRGETAVAVALQHVRGTPTPLSTLRPDLPVDVVRIVEKMMAREREERYQAAKEVLRDLARLGRDANRTLAIDEVRDGDSPPLSAVEPAAARMGGPAGGPSRLGRLATAAVAPGVLRWSVACSLVAALVLGAVVGRARRPPHPLDRLPRTSTSSAAIDLSGIERQRDGSAQLASAREATPSQREAAWWAVIQWYPDFEVETIEAARQLMERYWEERRYERALELADEFVRRNHPEQKTFGYFFRGLALSRLGRPADSNASFSEMFARGKPPRGSGPDELQWLARQYFLALDANYEALGMPRDPSLVDRFWRHFLRKA